MKIYKLSDEISENQEKLKITEIRQGAKNLNQVNVFINNKYAFSLDVAQVVDLGVKVGRFISQKELKEFKKASEFGKCYQRALEWVLMRPRSERELRDYLKRQKAQRVMKERKQDWERARVMTGMAREENGEKPSRKKNSKAEEKIEYNFEELIVEKLLAKGYVNDLNFARYYVENRFIKKGISKKRLRVELLKKGISKEIVEEVVSARDDEEEVRKMLVRKKSKYDDQKMIMYLVRQGFSYELVQRVMSELKEMSKFED